MRLYIREIAQLVVSADMEVLDLKLRVHRSRYQDEPLDSISFCLDQNNRSFCISVVRAQLVCGDQRDVAQGMNAGCHRQALAGSRLGHVFSQVAESVPVCIQDVSAKSVERHVEAKATHAIQVLIDRGTIQRHLIRRSQNWSSC